MTPEGSDPDIMFNIILVLHSQRLAVTLDEIPRVFLPVTGRWQMRSQLLMSIRYLGQQANTLTDLHKVFFDDKGYNRDHGEAYRFYGLNTAGSCAVIVRPDQCES